MTNNVPDNRISVDLARITSPQESLGRAPRQGFGLGTIVAGLPRSLGFAVQHDPITGNPSHSLILGTNTKELCQRMAENLVVVLGPDN
jgi:hypothetical protein